MKEGDLTDAEQELFDRLPGPPVVATVRTTHVWIVEWLRPDEKCTGRLLHEWMEDRRPNWSVYCSCKNSSEVIDSIQQAAASARQTGMIPVLHLEAHGGEEGLEGPGDGGGRELLSWDRLTGPLQQLNLATHCNLVLVVAACTGFAGIKALGQGPYAPAIAIVGPDSEVTPTNLLQGMKELYRRWIGWEPVLRDIVASASHEATTVGFEWESFTVLAFDAFTKHFILSMRPDERRRRVDRLRKKLLAQGKLTPTEIECRLRGLPLFPSVQEMQRLWDKMFMIDSCPDNRERFGVDMSTVLRMIQEGT
ncbi:hypothetical protein [Cupriavidus sp. 8B]